MEDPAEAGARATLNPINDGDDHNCADRNCGDPVRPNCNRWRFILQSVWTRDGGTRPAPLRSLVAARRCFGAVRESPQPRGLEYANFDCQKQVNAGQKVAQLGHATGTKIIRDASDFFAANIFCIVVYGGGISFGEDLQCVLLYH